MGGYSLIKGKLIYIFVCIKESRYERAIINDKARGLIFIRYETKEGLCQGDRNRLK